MNLVSRALSRELETALKAIPASGVICEWIDGCGLLVFLADNTLELGLFVKAVDSPEEALRRQRVQRAVVGQRECTGTCRRIFCRFGGGRGLILRPIWAWWERSKVG